MLSASQRNVFAEMVKDIVRQLKLNPNQIPVPTTTHRRTGSSLEKVCMIIDTQSEMKKKRKTNRDFPLYKYKFANNMIHQSDFIHEPIDHNL